MNLKLLITIMKAASTHFIAKFIIIVVFKATS